ncbi:leucine-rich repeat-containing protein 38 [Notechis scutatus]|uniref:Leucine-rich repeat-containing protein 38 n=1 Tax=Notechis scutatus TaxID=8663 RepID=A0A6J1VL19_9SAUR|nr:leucine-rich repeat-containing protein 38 [Notechis scutatus]
MLPGVPPLVLLCLAFFSLGHPCPATCSCTDSHTVDCRDRGLPGMPTPFPLDVRKLLMGNNSIQRVPGDFFIFHSDLVYLEFRNNAIAALPDGTFDSSGKLVYLDLSYNNLSRLGASLFRSAERLVKLCLGNNRLAEVDEVAFTSLKHLQVLELNHNRLQRLSLATLAALPNLRVLRLEGNPWLCDCDFAGLFTWLQENAFRLPQGLGEIRCTLPVEESSVPLSELTEASFRDCKSRLSLVDLLIIIFSGAAVSVAAIISSLVLALLVNCFQRCTPRKKEEEEEG